MWHLVFLRLLTVANLHPQAPCATGCILVCNLCQIYMYVSCCHIISSFNMWLMCVHQLACCIIACTAAFSVLSTVVYLYCLAMPLQCPLVQVSNGDVAEEVNTDNDQVQVLTCHPGYQPVGGVTRLVCNHTTGTWIAMEFINNGAEYTFGCEGRAWMHAVHFCMYF